VRVEDPYIRLPHQIHNFVRFCEVCVKSKTVRRIVLVTSTDPDADPELRLKSQSALRELGTSLMVSNDADASKSHNVFRPLDR
jgi:ATP-dependent Lon protease